MGRFGLLLRKLFRRRDNRMGMASNEVPSQVYIQRALVTRAIWLGNHPSMNESGIFVGMHVISQLFRQYNIRTYLMIINSCHDWRQFISTCYWLHCYRGRNWKDADGRKMTFYEWMNEANIRNDRKYRFDPQIFGSNSVVTVFDSRRNKRLIVDGMHRSAALTRACEEIPDFMFPQMMIFEAYGENVDIIFPCDCFQL